MASFSPLTPELKLDIAELLSLRNVHALAATSYQSLCRCSLLYGGGGEETPWWNALHLAVCYQRLEAISRLIHWGTEPLEEYVVSGDRHETLP